MVVMYGGVLQIMVKVHSFCVGDNDQVVMCNSIVWLL